MTVTVAITDPAVVPASVVLQRIDDAGRVLATLGHVMDDGTDGDAAAGDRTFTAQLTHLRARARRRCGCGCRRRSRGA